MNTLQLSQDSPMPRPTFLFGVAISAYRQRFGMMDVGYPTQKRTLKQSAMAYRNMRLVRIEENK
ncbi:hypothetical protein [Vibrio sp. CAU 1672]|uniref:hypothetical protein n=1 Tax=Vibrio sp. CAU 1672 TaxID=3032594 RepID=UPI0023DAD57D|nr:hypothetical protein [Vibrio sp. CAU 1672]MDF2155199.1 hypothetical protein [Vibrio sp. CAU 1672]